MSKLQIAIVGAGVIAEFHAKAVKDIPDAQLAAICDIDSEKADKLASQYGCAAFDGLENMLKSVDVDILTIATPSGLHRDPAITAAQYGIHTIIEKPLEVTVERINEIIDAHNKAGTKLGCIFQTRYSESLDPLRDAIKRQRFGRITFAGVYVPWWRSDDYYKDSWHGTWKLDGGGALMNQAIHMIDTLCELMPDIESVNAFTARVGHPDIEAEDSAAAALKFKNGALGVIHGSTACYPGQPKRLEIMGTEGTAVYLEDSYTVFEFKNSEPGDQQVLEKYANMDYKSGFSDPKAIAHTLHTKCFEDFIESIRTGTEFKISGPEASKSVKLIESIYKSAREGRTVSL
ncbi:putative oxidoreductase YcjS [Limihaloglobus sulfuriphilus]|uniref:Putative oxidoreductase YcjS n=1 Tax=Limihaloglobus sulfuriphilus TaxID=1851148 RepID=A0A1Q2MDC2_9BACT|nr:Gfo/Idh/MocA family oxidoreductase [Limihaloglobus sulfuriphilus]AQQ70548.1 putative oxidoreductase YcjS [Limihaloglobus sulfuriphilus]